jgi:hypothetical protein
VAKYGIYGAVAFAVMSVWLGQRAGATLDFTLLRAVFVFVIFTGLAFGADAVLTLNVKLTQPVQKPAEKESEDE